MRCPKKLFEPYPCLIYFQNAVPLANFQPKPARPANYHVGDVHGLELRVWGSGDVGKFEKFSRGRKYGSDWVSRMVSHLLENLLMIKRFMWHQLTVVVLEISENVSHGAIYEVFCAIADIRDIRLLECGNYLFDKVLINSRHFSKKKCFLVVTVMIWCANFSFFNYSCMFGWVYDRYT